MHLTYYLCFGDSSENLKYSPVQSQLNSGKTHPIWPKTATCWPDLATFTHPYIDMPPPTPPGTRICYIKNCFILALDLLVKQYLILVPVKKNGCRTE